MFTGDRSGDWLYRALHKAGFATHSNAVSRQDGLELNGCAITAICHCAPPANKPTRQEITNCAAFLSETIELLPVRLFLALGQLAWQATVDQLSARGLYAGRRPKFGHGALQELNEDKWLLGSYHPSQQNTFTGKLTEPMFDDIFRMARELVDAGE